MDFLDLLPTLMSCNFFSTEPILKISDVFSRWESNSFVSAVLVAQSKIGVPSHGYLWQKYIFLTKMMIFLFSQVLTPKKATLICYSVSQLRVKHLSLLLHPCRSNFPCSNSSKRIPIIILSYKLARAIETPIISPPRTLWLISASLFWMSWLG